MEFINQLLNFWITTHWGVALLMSTVVNMAVYVVAAKILEALTSTLTRKGIGSFINQKSLNSSQITTELRFGLSSCFIFALGSLLTRELFSDVWPRSVSDLFIQVAAFTVFYETYSYFIHRLLHIKLFIKCHGVHHKSVRVTPWSAYSVHPLEAIFIGLSAPIFMSIFPMSLGVALVLHIFGMIFTILLHSNYQHPTKFFLINLLLSYPRYHCLHHTNGGVNFGFVANIWDKVMGTLYKNCP